MTGLIQFNIKPKKTDMKQAMNTLVSALSPYKKIMLDILESFMELLKE